MQRPSFHQGADVLAEDSEQALGPSVLGVVRLSLLEDVVRQRPQDIAQQLLALARPAVEGCSGDLQLSGERLHIDAPSL